MKFTFHFMFKISLISVTSISQILYTQKSSRTHFFFYKATDNTNISLLNVETTYLGIATA
jgi:hypothetical protein